MKFFGVVAALFSVGLADVAPLTYTLPYAGYAPYAAPYAAYAAPYAVGSQFHAQDEFGNLNYGYSNLNSVKHEVGNTYGGVSGGYSYVDADGKLQQVTYVADALGFRTADSRLPVAPVYDGVAPEFNPEPLVAPVDTGVAPEPVQDTPEVAEARAAHLALVEAAKAEAAPAAERKRRDADAAVIAGASTILTAPTPFIHNAPILHHAVLPYAGLGYAGLHGYGYGLPIIAAEAPAAERKRREADPAILGGATTVLTAPTPLIHNAPALHHAVLPYAGLHHGYAGLGYAGLGLHGYGYGLGHAYGYGLPYAAHVL